ncbi:MULTISPECIES: gamma-glutamylcyclotransferase family protein [Salinivibrio]|uniref:Gamma-glutamylcyclotransferase AIG2-like domain-containing protein n=1 Tax=Salinivibrio kushneri TaxID=1908198 RepID=A0AB36K817_9GAMM|nr:MULTISPECIES: gamma-glutamylcyclotransferase family protein [Salinivibrio]ODP99228.1 hypothetical protein BGL48_09445 [Salinivibrio sp. BNH]OOE45804.1 hypothetical protein BZG09_03590 [Salinivibrio kushneri]
MLNNLFVYGTLCPEGTNHHVLADVHGQWFPASIQAMRTDRGWGSASGCPGIELSDNPNNRVEGWLLKADDLSHFLPHIDAFEGAGYQRVIVEVEYKSKSSQHAQHTTAFTYELCFNHQPDATGPSQFVAKNY